ncbi:MAG: hypothetical protein WDM87_16925 [Terracidiphilus sp.]
MREGWTAERFLDELQAKIGFKLDPAAEEKVPDDVLRDHVGIHPQRQDGLVHVGASVLRGTPVRRSTCGGGGTGGTIWKRRAARDCLAKPVDY